MARLPRVKPGDLVLVRWFDAWHDSSLDGPRSEIIKECDRIVLEWAGFFVTKQDGYVFIATERGGDRSDPGHRYLHGIPRVNILEMRLVEKWK